jgi:hypothetical protein
MDSLIGALATPLVFSAAAPRQLADIDPFHSRVRGEPVMTEMTLCGYCKELPEQGRAAAAHVQRCPLCKAELGVTRAGQRFRIDDAIPNSHQRVPVIAAVALAGGAVCLAFVAWLALHSRNAAETFVLPPPPAPIVAHAPVVESPAVVAAAQSATSK